MPPLLRPLALAFCATLIPPAAAHASGSYPPNPPRLGGLTLSQIDSRAYNLGKTLFLDRLTLPDTPRPAVETEANHARLVAVQALLPERVRSEVDLPALAPRLNSAQLDALLYYVGIRFRIDIPSAA